MATDETGATERAATLAWTTELTREAAARARRMAAGEMNVTRKDNGTLVTDIDREIERFLRAAIAERFPGHAILGEEFGREGADDARFLWALDPIDGTTNLANGLPFWCVSVGLIEDGRMSVGVCSAPMIGETFAAARGVGATLNGDALPPLAPGGPLDSEDPYGVCSTSVRTRDLSRIGGKLRILGSAALEVCYVGAGRTRGCQNFGVSLYDVAGAGCVAQALGAEMRWLDTNAPYDPLEHGRTGPRKDTPLVTAPPATLAYLRERLR
jgi:fructose-1,6-bisphosphatase/inositol monophosphatase family enzyme